MVKSQSFILVPLLLTFAILACNLGASAPSAAPTEPPAAQQNPPVVNLPPSGDARQALIDAYLKLETAYPYRLTETSTISACGEQTRVTEFAAPTEFHTVWTGCSMNSEVIATSNQWFYKIGGEWLATDQFTAEAGAPPDVTELVRDGLKSVTSGGNESVNGVDAYVYDFVLSLDEATDIIGKAWVGVADGLPHQAKAQYTLSGYAVDTTLIYEYGVPVNIQAPIP